MQAYFWKGCHHLTKMNELRITLRTPQALSSAILCLFPLMKLTQKNFPFGICVWIEPTCESSLYWKKKLKKQQLMQHLICPRTHTHTHTRTHAHTHTNSLATTSGYVHLAEPGCLCTKQALWAVQAKLLEPGWKLAGEQAFPHSKWHGHPKSHLDRTIAVAWEKALNLHPSKCQVPNHSWVDWWGWWKADGKPDGKLPEWDLNSGPSGPEPRTQPLHHTHTCTHTYI